MIDFESAAAIAKDNAKKLVPNAKNIQLEGVVISKNKKNYDVALSYETGGHDNLAASHDNPATLRSISYILGKQRYKKIFMVNRQTGEFVGFKQYEDL
ncbi:hypothetical protein [Acetobacter cerevisiae]|uniref:hypothetical protein n=1 Tax=Acetobacter cerevisiae TaxID=178900 RepID=UPI000A91870F|nr:hypothetical protein [Acetobacter cerevisiae]